MRIRTVAALLVSFVSFALPVQASIVNYQAADANSCHTTFMGFNTGTGCSSGETCVMADSSVGIVPTCMSTRAATTPNYTNSTDCSTACGHACTSNPNSYSGTYYCAPSTAAAAAPSASAPSQSAIPATNQQGNTGLGSSGNTTNTKGSSLGQTGNTRGSGQNVTLTNPLKAGTSLESFLNDILDFIIRIGTIVVILMIVFVGYKFVAARGNESELTSAKTMLLWTIIGALVLLGARAISLSLLATVQALGG